MFLLQPSHRWYCGTMPTWKLHGKRESLCIFHQILTTVIYNNMIILPTNDSLKERNIIGISIIRHDQNINIPRLSSSIVLFIRDIEQTPYQYTQKTLITTLSNNNYDLNLHRWQCSGGSVVCTMKILWHHIIMIYLIYYSNSAGNGCCWL